MPPSLCRSLLVTAISTIVLILSGDAAQAQSLPSLDTRTWRPSTDPNAGLYTEPAVTPGPWIYSFGGYVSYAFRPVTLRNAGSSDVAYRPVEHTFGLDAVANIGLGQRFAVGLDLPIVLVQSGDDNLPSTVNAQNKVTSTGVGDLALTMKGALLRNEGGGFGLAAIGNVTLPTGDRNGFFGEGSVTAGARLLAEYTLLVAVAQASLGYQLRTEHRTWPDASAGGFRFGDYLPWSVGFSLKPGILGVDPGNRQRWELAAHGWLPAGPVGPFGSGQPGSAAESPVLLGLSDRIEIGHYRDTFVTIGAEIGLSNAVGVPAVRGLIGFGWAPREHDLDHDGVRDDVDGCPEIPEDKDGFEDADGCPEIDNDDDGILDKDDACPNVKGVESKDPKKNGCPDGGTSAPQPVTPAPVSPDLDGDGIPNADDACPKVKGEPSSDPMQNGCPNADRDGDTFDNDVDKCPDQAEVWNGVADDDGCPDEGGKLLVTVDDKRVIKLLTPIKLSGAADAPDVDPASIPTIRALATELNKHKDWTLAIGVKPGTGDAAQMDALAKSFAIVRVLGSYSHRDGVAESINWDAVKSRPGAESGIGLLVLTTSKAP